MAAPRRYAILPLAFCLTVGTLLTQSAISFVNPSGATPYDMKSSNPLPLPAVLCGIVVVALWALLDHARRTSSQYLDKVSQGAGSGELSLPVVLATAGAVSMCLWCVCHKEASSDSSTTSDVYYLERQFLPMPPLLWPIVVVLMVRSVNFASGQLSTSSAPRLIVLQNDVETGVAEVEQNELECKKIRINDPSARDCEWLGGRDQFVSATASTLPCSASTSSMKCPCKVVRHRAR